MISDVLVINFKKHLLRQFNLMHKITKKRQSLENFFFKCWQQPLFALNLQLIRTIVTYNKSN